MIFTCIIIAVIAVEILYATYYIGEGIGYEHGWKECRKTQEALKPKVAKVIPKPPTPPAKEAETKVEVKKPINKEKKKVVKKATKKTKK